MTRDEFNTHMAAIAAGEAANDAIFNRVDSILSSARAIMEARAEHFREIEQHRGEWWADRENSIFNELGHLSDVEIRGDTVHCRICETFRGESNHYRFTIPTEWLWREDVEILLDAWVNGLHAEAQAHAAAEQAEHDKATREQYEALKARFEGGQS